MNAVATMMIGETAYSKYTLGRIKEYSERIGSEYVIIDEFKDVSGLGEGTRIAMYYEKFQLYNLLKKYDRIMFFDADILITNPKETPNFFERCPEAKLGTRVVGYISGVIAGDYMRHMESEVGNINFYVPNYICMGFLLASKRHIETFNLKRDEYQKILKYQLALNVNGNVGADMPDQNAYNYVAQVDGTQFYDIGPKNHFIPWSDPGVRARAEPFERKWENRLRATTVHYAGSFFKKYIEEDWRATQ